MSTVENIFDVLYDVESYETPKNKMSEDELRSLDAKHVKDWEVPEGSEFVGGYLLHITMSMYILDQMESIILYGSVLEINRRYHEYFDDSCMILEMD